MMDTQVWDKLKKFRVGDRYASLTFIDRLARENDWSTDFAKLVFQEYRRFIFLAWLGKIEVTPSDEIDQVWHLHMCYTKSYWKEMCQDILGKEIHHGPTLGGEVEDDRFYHQYEETKALYEKVFKSKPPEEVWPPAEKRFQDADQFIRLNRAEKLIVPKFQYFVVPRSKPKTIFTLLVILWMIPPVLTYLFGASGIAVLYIGSFLFSIPVFNLLFAPVVEIEDSNIRLKGSGRKDSLGVGCGYFGGGCGGSSGCGGASGCGGGGCGGGCGG